MMKTLLLMCGVVCAAFAYSQTIDQAARGKGMAANADKLPCAFEFQVGKSNSSGRVVVKGTFSAVFGKRESPTSRIVIREVQRAGFDGATVRFSGPAAFTRMVDGRERTVTGIGQIVVVDNRPAGVTTGNPDGILITWTSRDGKQTHTYRGRVMRGDIAVRRREP
jgi:hypothetical protein